MPLMKNSSGRFVSRVPESFMKSGIQPDSVPRH
jgi:hypothetical protein